MRGAPYRCARVRLLVALGLLAVPLLLPMPVAGQAVLDTAIHDVALMEGEAAEVAFELINPLNVTQRVFISLDGPQASWAEVARSELVLPPSARETIVVGVAAPEHTSVERGRVLVHFNVFNQVTNQPNQTTATIDLAVARAPLLFGFYEAPLLVDGLSEHAWVFLLEVTGWVLLAVLAVFLERTVIHHVAKRIDVRLSAINLERVVDGKLRTPLFLLIVLLGVRSSWRLLPVAGPTEVGAMVLTALVAVVVALALFRIVQAWVQVYKHEIAPRTETPIDDVLLPVVEKASAILIILGGIYMFFLALGVNLGVLIAGAGIAGLAIGFAAQDTLSNFFSGVFILLDRPFREGDDIQLETGEIVRVDDIGMRSTELYHYRNHEVIIAPNNELANKRIINVSYPDRSYRVLLNVGVSYTSDVRTVRDILLGVASEHPKVLQSEERGPRIFFEEFGDSSLNFQLRFFVEDVHDRRRVPDEVRERILERFRDAHVEIPFPQRDVWMRSTSGAGASGGGNGDAEGSEV